jgi:hypothetical protein
MNRAPKDELTAVLRKAFITDTYRTGVVDAILEVASEIKDSQAGSAVVSNDAVVEVCSRMGAIAESLDAIAGGLHAIADAISEKEAA